MRRDASFRLANDGGSVQNNPTQEKPAQDKPPGKSAKRPYFPNFRHRMLLGRMLPSRVLWSRMLWSRVLECRSVAVTRLKAAARPKSIPHLPSHAAHMRDRRCCKFGATNCRSRLEAVSFFVGPLHFSLYVSHKKNRMPVSNSSPQTTSLRESSLQES